MLEITRIYRNSSGDEVRIDTIIMVRKRNVIVDGVSTPTFRRELKTTLLHRPADRVVSTLEVIGSYDSIDTSTGDYTWATWDSPSARANMSDLPGIGDTV